MVKGIKHGVKLLGRGLAFLEQLDKPLFIEVSSASDEVIKRV